MQHEIRAIEELVFVTKLSFVPAHKDKEEGFRSLDGMGPKRFVLSVDDDTEFRSRCE